MSYLKECNTCHEIKTHKEFYINKQHIDGYRPVCKKCCNKKSSEYYEKNRGKISSERREYRKKNKEKIREKNKLYLRKRRKNDEAFVIRERISKLVYNSLYYNGYSKKSRTYEIIGCSYSDFKKHIEKQFLKGMTWDNRDLWHLDHVVPLSSAKTEQEIIDLNHFTNLRPLWADDNMEKSSKEIYLI